jgi:pimeloyl-ACP methyl ester carboxylesterase
MTELRPSPWNERVAARLLFALGPRLPRLEQAPPPDGLRPWEAVSVERPGAGPLGGIWYPAAVAEPRGAVLLVHPWLEWGKSYFHRRGRVQALRAAGYSLLAVDLGGFGGTRREPGFLDRDVEAAFHHLRGLAGDLPIHIWSVSAGAYWSHFLLGRLGRGAGVAGAMFEDVSPHLLEWSWRMAPLGRPFYLFFRHVLRGAYRYLDIRRHAPAMHLGAVSYVSGEKDRGILPDETRELAALAGGRALIVPGAGHLEAIKVANAEVIALALDTFRRAEDVSGGCRAPSRRLGGP